MMVINGLCRQAATHAYSHARISLFSDPGPRARARSRARATNAEPEPIFGIDSILSAVPWSWVLSKENDITLPPTNMVTWNMASWKTVFLYKPVLFHFHDCFREGRGAVTSPACHHTPPSSPFIPAPTLRAARTPFHRSTEAASCCVLEQTIPRHSMYAIYAYIDPQNHPIVGIYGIHGVSGYRPIGIRFRTSGPVHDWIQGHPARRPASRFARLALRYRRNRRPRTGTKQRPPCESQRPTRVCRA